MSPHRRRVLFVSYAFPPTGGVGVQRVTKFVKYLPQFGWDCSVLTVANPSVPLTDDSVSADIPKSTIIRRARTWEPGYAVKQAVSASGDAGDSSGLKQRIKQGLRRIGNVVLQPDPQILWRPAALKLGRTLLRQVQHDAIIATGPPFSSLLLGGTLSRQSGVPLVLDYRDEWGISNAYWENKRQGKWSNRVQQWMQRSALRAARLVLATTPSSTQAVANLGRFTGSSADFQCITNGFDPDDFPFADRPRSHRYDYGHGIERFRMTFVGTLWNLNPIGPLVQAIERLAHTAPRLLAHLELVLAGRRTAEQEALLDRLKLLPCAVVRLPFVTHQEACRLMRDADSLLLLNADLPETNRIINAKTFEYMAARRPMFVVAPRGDLTDVVQDLPGTALCDPANPEQIAERLSLVLERHRCGMHDDDATWNISQFERRHLASQLAEALDIVSERHPVPPRAPATRPAIGQPTGESA